MTTNGEVLATDTSKKPAATSQPDDTAIPQENLGMENLAKVRDILFGAQMRAYDKRMTRLEEHLAKELAELKEDTKKRLASLEMFAKRENESLLERLNNEAAQRGGGLKGLRRELEQTAETFGQQTAQLNEQLAKSERMLNQHILDQTHSLRDQVQEKYAALEGVLERELQTLRANAADRAELGSYLMEMGLRLRNELELPDVE